MDCLGRAEGSSEDRLSAADKEEAAPATLAARSDDVKFSYGC